MRLGEKCPALRECCVCSASVTSRSKVIRPTDPSILTLTLLVYRRTRSGRQLGAAKKSIYLCELCLRSILECSPSATHKASRLGDTVACAIEARYNAMCEAKPA